MSFQCMLEVAVVHVWGVDSGGSKEARITWGAYCRNLANTIEPSVCGNDAAFLSN